MAGFGPRVAIGIFVICVMFPVFGTAQVSRKSTRFLITELEFRLTSEVGEIHVTEDQWRDFVEDEILPLFHDIQERDAVLSYIRQDDEVVREPAKIVSIRYAQSHAERARSNIELIRRRYKEKLKQDTVLRFDFLSPVRILH